MPQFGLIFSDVIFHPILAMVAVTMIRVVAIAIVVLVAVTLGKSQRANNQCDGQNQFVSHVSNYSLREGFPFWPEANHYIWKSFSQTGAIGCTRVHELVE